MQAHNFRKIVFSLNYTVIFAISFLFHYLPLKGLWAISARILGLIIILLSGGFAFYVHSFFPKRHKRPEDFPRLIKEGPYRYKASILSLLFNYEFWHCPCLLKHPSSFRLFLPHSSLEQTRPAGGKRAP